MDRTLTLVTESGERDIEVNAATLDDCFGMAFIANKPVGQYISAVLHVHCYGKSAKLGKGVLMSRSGNSMGSKCTADIKSFVPEDTKDALIVLASKAGMNLSEYVRHVLMQHVHGHVHMVRLQHVGMTDHEAEGQG